MSYSQNYAKYIEEINPHPEGQDVVVFGKKPTDVANVKTEYIQRFAGLDLAKRVDHSALAILRMKYSKELGHNYLYQEAHQMWPHINYKIVAADCWKIFNKYPWEMLGFDRSGVGDAAQELFDVQALNMQEIITTMERKKDIIKIIKGLFEMKKLVVDSESEIKQQILEQETIISNAGNELYQHPPRRHDDLFWALGYACYVALPYVIGMPAPIIRRIAPENRERDIDAEIDSMMGGADSIMSFN